MKRFTLLIIVVTVSSLLIPAARTHANPQTVSAEAFKSYEIIGVLINFDSAREQAIIAHETIPGYMEAMTMAFDIRDRESMLRLRPGDKLKGRLCVAGNDAWIDMITSTGPGLVLSPAAETSPAELSLGQTLPDVTLINQSGVKIRLSDFQGQPLAITFIYTRCPLPTYCPLLSRHFKTAQGLLDQISPQDSGRFLSISMDPLHDSPEVLAAYAKSYQADRARWTFATGLVDDINTLGEGVGLQFRNAAGRVDHNLRTVVIDKFGRIQHIFRGNQWTPQELVSEMMIAARQ